ncbi:MAG: prolyl oligopeptidase family serine peptidase, partial [Lachnospiraceae bacterium]|nr:prolyl oligopeptidase family serine peptidase [Lachnospiraceae bacterium]
VPNGVGLIYPAVTVADDKIQVVMADVETYNDPEARKQFSERYEMKTHVKEGDAPMFLCNTLDDNVIDPFHMVDFARACRDKKVPFEMHVFPYGGHGFGGCKPQPAPPIPGMSAPDYSAVEQWKDLFVNWLDRTLK